MRSAGPCQLLGAEVQNIDSSTLMITYNPIPVTEVEGVVPRSQPSQGIFSDPTFEVKESQTICLIA